MQKVLLKATSLALVIFMLFWNIFNGIFVYATHWDTELSTVDWFVYNDTDWSWWRSNTEEWINNRNLVLKNNFWQILKWAISYGNWYFYFKYIPNWDYELCQYITESWWKQTYPNTESKCHNFTVSWKNNYRFYFWNIEAWDCDEVSQLLWLCNGQNWTWTINNWYKATEIYSANSLASKGFIENHSDNYVDYKLNNFTNKLETADLARRIAGLEKKSICENKFSDVTSAIPNDWACYSIEALLDAGLIAANPTFRPEMEISKAEAIGMLVKSGFGDEYSFDPTLWTSWQKQLVSFVVSKGIIVPFSDYDSSATRGFLYEVTDNILIIKEHVVETCDQVSQLLWLCNDNNWTWTWIIETNTWSTNTWTWTNTTCKVNNWDNSVEICDEDSQLLWFCRCDSWTIETNTWSTDTWTWTTETNTWSTDIWTWIIEINTWSTVTWSWNEKKSYSSWWWAWVWIPYKSKLKTHKVKETIESALISESLDSIIKWVYEDYLIKKNRLWDLIHNEDKIWKYNEEKKSLENYLNWTNISSKYKKQVDKVLLKLSKIEIEKRNQFVEKIFVKMNENEKMFEKNIPVFNMITYLKLRLAIVYSEKNKKWTDFICLIF